jgi:hypothetical protein
VANSRRNKLNLIKNNKHKGKRITGRDTSLKATFFLVSNRLRLACNGLLWRPSHKNPTPRKWITRSLDFYSEGRHKSQLQAFEPQKECRFQARLGSIGSVGFLGPRQRTAS